MSRVPLFLALLITCIPASIGASDQDPASALSLEVVLSDKRLDVSLGTTVIRSYPVAIGTIDHPTPEGTFRINGMIWNPPWYPPDRKWAAGLRPTPPGHPNNPMRVVKIPFDPPYYYIHGTDKPGSVGTLASHGCLRMSEDDVEELGKLLMRFGGQQRSETWYSRLLQAKKAQPVELDRPATITIRMGETNVYPGVVWNVD